VTPLQIRTEIAALLHATRPEQRSSYERALLALATLVDQTTSTIDNLARRLMTAPQLDRINDLRSAVPNTAERPDPQDEIIRLHQLLRDLVEQDSDEAWEAAIAEVGPRNQSRHGQGDAP